MGASIRCPILFFCHLFFSAPTLRMVCRATLTYGRFDWPTFRSGDPSSSTMPVHTVLHRLRRQRCCNGQITEDSDPLSMVMMKFMSWDGLPCFQLHCNAAMDLKICARNGTALDRPPFVQMEHPSAIKSSAERHVETKSSPRISIAVSSPLCFCDRR